MATLAISKLRRDGGTQFRAVLHEDVVTEYAAALKQGDKFPAIVAFYDGTDHWLADGFHTTAAHEKNGAKEIEADVRPGTQRDARLYAATLANRNHGIRFSNDEKRARILALIEDTEWSQWSNVVIAERCGVSKDLVRLVRDEHQPAKSQVTKRMGADGKERKLPAKKPKADKPAVAPAVPVEAPKPTPKPSAKMTTHGAQEPAPADVPDIVVEPAQESEPRETGAEIMDRVAAQFSAGEAKSVTDPSAFSASTTPPSAQVVGALDILTRRRFDIDGKSRLVVATLDELISEWSTEGLGSTLASLFLAAAERAVR